MRSALLTALFLIGSIPAAAQPDATLHEARRLLFEGKPRAAVALFEESPKRSPEGSYLLGRSYQALLQHGRAAQAFARADTANADVLAAWGRSLRQLGRLSEAQARYRQAYRLDTAHRSVARPLAQLYAQAGQWTLAKAVLTRLVRQDPENPVLLARLGTAYEALDSTQAAARAYEESLRLNPQSVEVALRLSTLYLSADSVNAARRVVERGLAEQPRSSDLWRRRGTIALQANQYAPAADAFQHARALGDSSAAILRDLGITRYLNEQDTAAAPPLRRAYQADSTQARTAFYLGLVEKSLGRMEAACFHLERAAQLYRPSALANAQAQLADVYFQQRQYASAIRADRLALRLDSTRKTALFHLATVYDAYYADPSPALHHYTLFLKSAAARKRPDMQSYARSRVSALKQQQFFNPPPVSDTAAGGTR